MRKMNFPMRINLKERKYIYLKHYIYKVMLNGAKIFNINGLPK